MVEVASTLGLDFVIVVEVDSTSTSKDVLKAAGRVPSVEEVDSKNLSPTVSGEVFLC